MEERSEKMKKLHLATAFVVLFSFLYAQAFSEVPKKIRYQGKSTDANVDDSIGLGDMAYILHYLCRGCPLFAIRCPSVRLA